jgi:hypothetical protein
VENGSARGALAEVKGAVDLQNKLLRISQMRDAFFRLNS